MDYIARINARFEELGLYPDLEAFDICDLRNHIVLVDRQEPTVFRSAEGCYRWLCLGCTRQEEEGETREAVFQALQPNRVDAIRVVEDSGLWRQDHYAIDDE